MGVSVLRAVDTELVERDQWQVCVKIVFGWSLHFVRRWSALMLTRALSFLRLAIITI